MDKLYRISEVAKKLNISRTALIHYDNSGLLSPSIRNEKKYRFYTPDDIQKLELILALKESGLSLKEIKLYLSEVSSKSSIELLLHQKDEIDNKILELTKQRQIIEKRIAHLSQFNSVDLYDGILLDEYPEMRILEEPIGYGPLMSYESAVSRLKRKIGHEGPISSKFGICFDISHANGSGKYRMKYVFDYLNVNENTQETTTIPGSKYLRCLHKGQYITAEETIKLLIAYANEHNYEISGDAYYVPLFDYWESVSDEHIGEILLPIENAL